MEGAMINKTHVLDLFVTGCQYLNHQVSLCFCAIHNVGQSVGSGTRTSAGRSVGLSAESRNVVHFHPVTPKNVNQILGSIKT